MVVIIIGHVLCHGLERTIFLIHTSDRGLDRMLCAIDNIICRGMVYNDGVLSQKSVALTLLLSGYLLLPTTCSLRFIVLYIWSRNQLNVSPRYIMFNNSNFKIDCDRMSGIARSVCIDVASASKSLHNPCVYTIILLLFGLGVTCSSTFRFFIAHFFSLFFMCSALADGHIR